MAKLFKHKLLKEKLEKFIIPDLDQKITILQNWQNAFQDGSLQKKTESQCEQAFNQDIFVSVLGYQNFPASPYTIEHKANTETSAQKPDSALGFFTNAKKNVQVVCEIKDAKTSLEKAQKREGNLSPIQQAFKYKPQYPDCRFVIATNFIEIKLFKDNQLDFETFLLADLVSDKNDYYEFKKFYWLLCAEHLISKKGISKTEQLLSEIRQEQNQITKEFYQKYKTLRLQLIENIQINNSNLDINLIIEKAQKLIDRLIFVCFCEDLDLLPENILQKVIQTAQGGFVDLQIYDVLRNLFQGIDQGSSKLEIPNGYNGELFKPDAVLDSLKIDDQICTKFIEFGKYNFAEDLSVNILGHIFEQSISDLENIKSEYAGETLEKKQSKRKKDGIYYTPDYIVDYIVNQAVGGYLKEQEEQIINKHGLKSDIQQTTYDQRYLKAYEEYQTVLQNIKVLDPACGSGAFLVKVFDYLLTENQRVANLLTDLRGGSTSFLDTEDHIKEILQKNIYGVDLNQESVEITKLSLWLKTAQKGRKLANLHNNIKCGNSLIDDSAVAGIKAFHWQTEFKEIMEQGGFDVVVGNPPYVFARDNNFTEIEKKYYYKNFDLQSYQINTYILFTEKSLALLKSKGMFGFIIPNNWQTIDTCKNFRKFIFKSLTNIIIINSQDKIFQDANVDNGVLIFQNLAGGYYNFIELERTKFLLLTSGSYFKNKDYIVNFNLFKNQSNIKIINKINNQSKKIAEIAQIKSGIVAYEIGKGHPKQTKEIKELRAYHAFKQIDKNWEKYLDGVDVKRYNLDWCGQWIKYGENLAAKRNLDLFSKERILVRQIPSKYPKCINSVYVTETFINDRNSNNIVHFDINYNPKYISLLLNSKVISFWFINTFDKLQRGLFPQFKVKELAAFPIYPLSQKLQQPFIEKTDLMLELNLKLQSSKQGFLNELELEKIPKKLQSFEDLEFNNFIKEYKKAKKLKFENKLQERNFKNDWEALFENDKKVVLELQNQIDKTNQEIDQMVYQLYGLTEEEIKIIEESN